MPSKKKPSSKKDIAKKSVAPIKTVQPKPAAKAAKKPTVKAPKKTEAKSAVKTSPVKQIKKTVAKPAAKPAKVKASTKAKIAPPKAVKKTAVAKAPKKIEEKTAVNKPKVQKKDVAKKVNNPEVVTKTISDKFESSLIAPGVKFLKVPFFFDAEKDEKDGKHKRAAWQRFPEKPTASSRPKIGSVQDTKNLVELLSLQLEYENKMFLEGCEGQICVKCNINNVDSKFYVDKFLGYCADCAILLGLGQSKEGVFSDAQMELMRRSMEKTIEGTKDIDEDDIESVLGDMDSFELEEALLAVEEVEFNG